MEFEALPNAWRLTTLAELGEVNRGRSRHRPRHATHLYGGPYPFVQTGDIKASGGRITSFTQTYSEAGLAQSRLWPAGTMCITIAATIAETAILSFPACFPDSVVGFIPEPSKCDGYFVEFMFRLLRSGIQFRASGSVQDNINLQTIQELRFPLPPLDEQRAIARVLGALDDKIELNRRMNRTLEEMAMALFRSWFVDFDPVVAKAAGRKPAHLRPDLAALFPTHFQDSELGPIPQGWNVRPIGDVVKVVGGSTPSTNEPKYWGGNIAWATPRDLASLNDPVLLATERQITPAGLECISSGLLPAGTVLLSSRAPIGYTAISEIPVAVNQGFIALGCEGPLPNHYVIEWLRENMDTIEAHANGTTFMEISKKNFRPIPAIIPTPKVVTKFSEIVGPWWQQIVHNVRESRTLAALRDTLLPKLLSGELRVKSAEKLVEAAA